MPLHFKECAQLGTLRAAKSRSHSHASINNLSCLPKGNAYKVPSCLRCEKLIYESPLRAFCMPHFDTLFACIEWIAAVIYNHHVKAPCDS
jgi:hypothetical protein